MQFAIKVSNILPTDTIERRQALIALILANYPFGWEDICNALERMAHRNLAKKIKEKFCSDIDGSRRGPQNPQGYHLYTVKIRVFAGHTQMSLFAHYWHAVHYLVFSAYTCTSIILLCASIMYGQA